MKAMPLLLIFVLLFTTAMVGLAEQEEQIAITGTFGGEAAILPDLGAKLSLDLSFTYADFKLISATGFTIIPAVAGTQAFTLEYQHDPFTLGAKLNLTLLPPAFQSLQAYMTTRLFSMLLIDETLSLDANLRIAATILPSFSGTTRLTMNAATGQLTMSSITLIGLPPPAVEFQQQRFQGEWDFLETTLGEHEEAPTLTGDLGAIYTVFPGSLTGNLWFSLSLTHGGITATSKTTLETAPVLMGSGNQQITIRYTMEGVTVTSETNLVIVPAVAFTSQTIRVEINIESLRLYALAGFTPATDPSLVIGFRYSFP